jgi:glycosyltransferase involved in cell wall biosynthesis
MNDFTGDSDGGEQGQITDVQDVNLLSPYHGGSHRAWAEGYRASSRHNIVLLTMPDRFWKWRMHGGAITLSREYLHANRKPDCLLVTDMLDLTTFLALTRNQTATVPVILYMHENQLTYPLPEDPELDPIRRQRGERDLHYGFINLASMLAADVVLFNSEYHKQELTKAILNFLKHFPDFNELSIQSSLVEKGRVIPVGVDLKRLTIEHQGSNLSEPPLIIWNHRWEYDKDPGRFFDALYRIQMNDVPFRLALCGRNYRKRPAEFETALDKLSPNIIHFGFADEDTYKRLLWEAAIVVSTARHEFFGVSTVEALYCHSLPILPWDLSYPEIVPSEFHSRCLFTNDEQLVSNLTWALLHPEESRALAADIAHSVTRFEWASVSPMYDEVITSLCDIHELS